MTILVKCSCCGELKQMTAWRKGVDVSRKPCRDCIDEQNTESDLTTNEIHELNDAGITTDDVA